MRHNIILCCLGLAVALSIATSPFLIGNAINLYLSQDNYYLPTISIACLLILATPALRLSANIYLQKISAKTRLNMKTRILKNLFTTNFSADRKSGELIDLIDGDVDGALYLYHGIFLDLTINSTIIILALFMIAYYYPLMIIAPLAAMTLSASLYFLTKKNCNNLYTEYVTENTTTIGKICNLLTSAKKNKNKSLQEDVKKINSLAFVSSLKVSILEALSGTSYLLGISMMLFIGAHAISNGLMTTGAIVASSIYIERVLGPTTALISIYLSSREAFYRRSRIHNHMM